MKKVTKVFQTHQKFPARMISESESTGGFGRGLKRRRWEARRQVYATSHLGKKNHLGGNFMRRANGSINIPTPA